MAKKCMSHVPILPTPCQPPSPNPSPIPSLNSLLGINLRANQQSRHLSHTDFECHTEPQFASPIVWHKYHIRNFWQIFWSHREPHIDILTILILIRWYVKAIMSTNVDVRLYSFIEVRLWKKLQRIWKIHCWQRKMIRDISPYSSKPSYGHFFGNFMEYPKLC